MVALSVQDCSSPKAAGSWHPCHDPKQQHHQHPDRQHQRGGGEGEDDADAPERGLLQPDGLLLVAQGLLIVDQMLTLKVAHLLQNPEDPIVVHTMLEH